MNLLQIFVIAFLVTLGILVVVRYLLYAVSRRMALLQDKEDSYNFTPASSSKPKEQKHDS